jgi:4-amino-4-deoxy-L-arabinose transferase-like glycosyltransferase
MAKGSLIFLILCFSLMRIVNLNADFPSGITRSGALYTDEGMYTVAAMRHALTGHWYEAGDVHMAIPQPVGQILHRISFALFGTSLASARITVVISFLLLVALAAFLIRRRFGDYAALLAALMLTSNYVGFAYSRLATMDLVATCFVVASLFVAFDAMGKRALPRVLIASLLLGAGMLTKANAAFAIPLLAFLAWRSGVGRRQRVLLPLASGLAVAILCGGYWAITSTLFPGDFAPYKNATIGNLPQSFLDWTRNLLLRVFACPERLGEGFVDLTLLFTFSALVVSRRYRRDPLVHLLAGYILVYLVALSLDSYGPSRYYAPLLIPFAGLCATACIALVDRLQDIRFHAARLVPAILVALSLGEGWRIVAYLSRPSYSFYNMTHAVAGIIREREGTTRGVLLYGDMASSVSLEAGTNAVNSWPGKNHERIERYHPKYAIVLVPSIIDTITSEGGVATELGAWDVFGNHYYLAKGEPVRLYSVRWPRQDGERSKLKAMPYPG